MPRNKQSKNPELQLTRPLPGSSSEITNTHFQATVCRNETLPHETTLQPPLSSLPYVSKSGSITPDTVRELSRSSFNLDFIASLMSKLVSYETRLQDN